MDNLIDYEEFANQFAKMQVSGTPLKHIADTKEVLFGDNTSGKFVGYKEYVQNNGYVTDKSIGKTTIYVQHKGEFNSVIPLGKLEASLIKQKKDAYLQRTKDKVIPEKVSKALADAGFKEAGDIRNRHGLPPAKITRPDLDKNTHKDGNSYLQGEARFFHQENRGERGRIQHPDINSQGISGHDAPDIMVFKRNGDVLGANITKGSTLDTTHEHLKATYDADQVLYKSYTDNNSYITASSIRQRGSTPEKYIAQLKDEMPGGSKVMIRTNDAEMSADVVLAIDKRLRSMPMQEQPKQMKAMVGASMRALHGEKPLDGETLPLVMVQDRGGKQIPQRELMINKPDYYKKVMEATGLSSYKIEAHLKASGAHDLNDPAKLKTPEGKSRKEQALYAARGDNAAPDGPGDGEAIWLMNSKTKMKYRADHPKGQELLASGLSPQEVFFEARNPQGRLNKHMESLHTAGQKSFEGSERYLQHALEKHGLDKLVTVYQSKEIAARHKGGYVAPHPDSMEHDAPHPEHAAPHPEHAAPHPEHAGTAEASEDYANKRQRRGENSASRASSPARASLDERPHSGLEL